MVDEFVIDSSDRKELGRTGEYVAAIGIGTWDIRNKSNMIDALSHAVSLGLDLVDTAEMYGNGFAEEVVGEVVKIVGRDNIFITTKLLPEKFSDAHRGIKSAEASLKRLGIKYADLILIHWYTPSIPMDRMISVLEAIKDKGYTRYIGVSNFSVDELSLALSSLSKYDLVVNQVKYSVLDRSVERELLPFMVREGITVQAYTPLERGSIVYHPDIKRFAKRYGKTPAQIALNYLICHERVTTIPKTERINRIEEFKGALGWRLSVEDILKLKSL
jgi:diketogulonate reductase-like aldo/keto reductase